MRPLWVAALPLALLISACAVKEIPLPATTKVLDNLPRVENSTKSPCWQQQQIAAQNSYLASIKAKKAVVYKAPCEVDVKPEPRPTS